MLPLLALYLTSLGGVGFLGPDEPRYASIGRAMARSWDWLTPRLDGQPWFEKPPLLYWLTGLGHLLHLSDEWAARLPIALLSLVFLFFFYDRIQREFSEFVAVAATGILATSAGWMAYSFVSLTDLPMTITLAAAALIALFDTRPGKGWSVGVLLGLSILAKGLVPLVLFAPLFLIARGKRLATIAGALSVATPWYLACWWKNGSVFIDEFFWKHHVQRFLSPILEHPQPFWYYLPVLLGLLFPWTPLIFLLVRGKLYEDIRVRFLAAWALYGLVFFSASVNKLPGYVLPLMPALAILMAVGLESVGKADLTGDDVPGRSRAWWMAACSLLLIAMPTVAHALPQALLSGVRTVEPQVALAVPFLLVAAAVFALAWTGRSTAAALVAVLAVVVAGGYVKANAFPTLDTRVSARSFARAHAQELGNACAGQTRRAWIYGLNYYSPEPLLPCEENPKGMVVEGQSALTISKR